MNQRFVLVTSCQWFSISEGGVGDSRGRCLLMLCMAAACWKVFTWPHPVLFPLKQVCSKPCLQELKWPNPLCLPFKGDSSMANVHEGDQRPYISHLNILCLWILLKRSTNSKPWRRSSNHAINRQWSLPYSNHKKKISATWKVRVNSIKSSRPSWTIY